MLRHKEADNPMARAAAHFELSRRRVYANLLFMRLPPVVIDVTSTERELKLRPDIHDNFHQFLHSQGISSDVTIRTQEPRPTLTILASIATNAAFRRFRDNGGTGCYGQLNDLIIE